MTLFCKYDYSHVVTVEELENDLPKLLEDLKLEISITSLDALGGHKTGSDKTIETQFMNQLTEKQKEILVKNIYKTDYKMLSKFYSYDWTSSQT